MRVYIIYRNTYKVFYTIIYAQPQPSMPCKVMDDSEPQKDGTDENQGHKSLLTCRYKH